MALALLIFLSAITLASAYLFYHASTLMPVAASATAAAIDQSLWRNIALVGVVFLLAQFLLAALVWNFRASRSQRSISIPNGERKIEFTAIALAVVLFMSMNITGQSTWARSSPIEKKNGTEDAIRVEVVAEQFRWYFRYPGADRVFGKTRIELQDASLGNPLGMDPADNGGKDDIVKTELTLPAGRDVEVILRTHDVIHSFFVPALRLKQDTLPGRPIPLLLRVDKAGDYEIVCAELCGLGHHTMNARMKVMSAEEFAAWSSGR